MNSSPFPAYRCNHVAYRRPHGNNCKGEKKSILLK